MKVKDVKLKRGVIQMLEKGKQDILIMAFFVVTRDDVLTCAEELGMSKEQVTDDVIRLVKEKVSQDLGSWREVVKDMVKKAIECPLGLVCSPSCAWQEVCGCISPKEAT